MTELRQGLDLTTKALLALLGGSKTFRQQLQGHLPMHVPVQRQVDLAHAAFTDLVEEQVVA
jgi:hypothetical protein